MPKNRRLGPRAIVEPIEPREHLSVARPAFNTGTGFFVSGGKIYDANGNEFVMKGVNAIHAWGSYTTNYNAIDQIAKTGANAARLVMYQDIVADPSNSWNDAADTPARRKQVVERYLANGIVAVVEDHASIQDDSSVTNPAALDEITTHWIQNAAWLKQYEKGVILNIANEWGPASGKTGNDTTWRDSYITEVQRLRAGADGTVGTSDDITNLIEIDAAGWGQDFNSLALHAQAIEDADPQHNVVFSIHLYNQWRDESRAYEVTSGASDYGPWDINSSLSSLVNRAQGLPLVIGEWAWQDYREYYSSNAPYANYGTQRVMQIADQLGIGWTSWVWNQSNSGVLNLNNGTSSYNSNTDLSDWGDAVINDPTYGLKASAKRATVFPFAGLPNPASPLPALPTSMSSATKLVLGQTSVGVPEGGQAAAQLRLSAQPTSNVVVNLTKSSGDADLNLVTTQLTFTPGNWSTNQSIGLGDNTDADTMVGTAKFQLAATGLSSTDFSAKEIESTLPTGTVTLNPTADRKYNTGSTSTTAVVTNTTWPQPTGAFFMKFDLTGRGGRVSNAVLRLYKTTASSNLTVRVFESLTDSWTEASTAGIHQTIPLGNFVVANAANSYVDFDVTSAVSEQMLKDGTITLSISTSTAAGATFQTRENVNPPQLMLTTVAAVAAPTVTAASFDRSGNPSVLRFSFDKDVSALLDSADVLLESISNPSQTLSVATPVYDAATNTATFALSPGVVPDGTYRATLLGTGVHDAAGNTVVGNRSVEFSALSGDVNSDGVVNFDDLLIVAQNYGQSGRNFSQGNVDYDPAGNVNFSDVLVLSQHYGARLATMASATTPFGVSDRSDEITSDILS